MYTGLEGLDRLIPSGVVNYDLVSQVMLQANMIPQQLSTSYLYWFACRFENRTQFCYVLFFTIHAKFNYNICIYTIRYARAMEMACGAAVAQEVEWVVH